MEQPTDQYKEFKEILDKMGIFINASTDYPALFVEKSIEGLITREEGLKEKLISNVLEILTNKKLKLSIKIQIIENLKNY